MEELNADSMQRLICASRSVSELGSALGGSSRLQMGHSSSSAMRGVGGRGRDVDASSRGTSGRYGGLGPDCTVGGVGLVYLEGPA